MTNLEKRYLISLRESEQVAAGPELEKASELKNEATLEKKPSELASSIDNKDIYDDEEEMAEDVGEVVVESIINFLMESSDEEFGMLMERLNESEIDYCINLLESFETLNEGKKAGTKTKTKMSDTKKSLITGGIGAGIGGALGHSGVKNAIGTGLAAIGGAGKALGVLGAAGAGAAGAGALAYGVKKGIDAAKNEYAARNKVTKYYDGTRDLTTGVKDGNEDIGKNYNYALRRFDRKDKLYQNKVKHAESIEKARENYKYAKKAGGDIEDAKQKLKDAKKEERADARVIKRQEKLKAKLARNQGRRDIAAEKAGQKTSLSESFSDLELMYLLEDAGYDATLDNLILLKEGFESGEWTIIYECNYTDYELCEILDESGYEVSDSNVQILREGLINGTYTI